PDEHAVIETRCCRDCIMSGPPLARFTALDSRRCRLVHGLFLFLLLVFFSVGAGELGAKTKQKSTPRREPELKIIDLKISPLPYAPENGALDFTVIVQLPKEVDEALMLEVSSLVTSASMTSLRFLSNRQAINDHQPSTVVATPGSSGEPEPKRVRIHLSWDGLDHNKQLAPPGSYDYMVRAKLLSNDEKRQKTQMLSWPKRGTFVVK
ncbi:MAG: hypothetical protein AB7V39_27975, partial [Nitrospiraceae bacterium]